MSDKRKLKLAMFREKFDSILKVGRNESSYDAVYPVSVELSLTNACNLKCVWCCDSTIRRKYPGHIDKKILFQLFKDLAKGGTKGITVEGGGEPTLHPDFPEIIDEIKKNNLAAGLFSNGVKINEALAKIDSFEWIRISLDADSSFTFRKYKGKDAYDTVLKNIGKLAAKKKKTVLGVGYVATKYNMGYIEDLIESLRDMGVDYFYIRPIEDYPQYFSQNDLEWLSSYSTPSFNVDVNYAGRIGAGNSGLPCLCHSVTSVISADASVYICGRLHIHKDHKAIGNLKKNTFNEIWNGAKRKELANRLQDPSFTRKKCPVCRITIFNEFINDIIKTKTINFI